MKQRQSRGLMPWILTLLCAVLLTVWVLGSMPAAPKEGAAVAAGTAYLDSAAAKDASAIAETLREREKQRRAELLAQQKKEERDALVAKITSGELDIWSMFDSYVILEAKTLLKYSNMSVQEIAYYLNFPNQSFFGSYFKRNTGMSPSQYKAQN